ncbi:2-C-methyl-D-erythritol 2,4-cyclodiphosphate synthase [Clostridium felsineum]|uniref:2-C-methyl-D-erythritol 2,4-cyclodiphosphate synthase n=1 Tax=Clostridium felsineum TaxID=36839 RepID=A0A1S8L9U0_9CLOT|nr:2-C-methyl-D-erythritol 2,4-cyclodiphosphate synthase [Clostridium felsineum]MCR3759565.1 2-C-methyl-D-erythritol 2,4-cyclodiphosphate synthase [Clostridium felsineum]URZ05023.1 2-C-methyl-D-erythritol 2,4-cyclodiphosphate synthase [Clostridium felsineum]URZ10064.1 2-C-methyl-D-erythritol 2,4-cyclodiphosphate synthase [Clostridium felsineum]URZ18039.1 2-C-methyl-D-erythritol 2,4-cyclodiphosphate synthase [Clostridium felsineum DSM 794]
MRVGIGYDVHKLVENRKLILGGIEIEYSKGLLGHSDADVLIHAIIDSILGAAGLGDIGKLFPDNDDKYKGISSLKLLSEVNTIIKNKGYRIGNIDSTIIAQKPKLSPYIEDIKKSLCTVLDIDLENINVKATTEEGLGFTGSGEGISSQSICLLV